MTAHPKIPRPATLLALAVLAVIVGGCVKTVVRAPNIIYGTFTDSRDGQTYRTVVIGEQTWMAENLNFKTERSVCYENADSNCTKYGRLYDWDDAMTACPAGWKLPNDEDWDSLVVAVGGKRVEDREWEVAGKKLKSKIGWKFSWRSLLTGKGNGNGTDKYGFSALPGGRRWGDGSFSDVGDDGNWWSATELDAYHVRYRYMYNNNTRVSWYGSYKKSLYSLRCVEDIAK